jgi:hypothetical protein
MRTHPLDFADFGGMSNPSYVYDIRLCQRCTLIPISFQASLDSLRNRVAIMP